MNSRKRWKQKFPLLKDSKDNLAKFDERLKELLDYAKKKKNILDEGEVTLFLADLNLDEEQYDKASDFLEQNNVDILPISGDDDIEPGMMRPFSQRKAKMKEKAFWLTWKT